MGPFQTAFTLWPAQPICGELAYLSLVSGTTQCRPVHFRLWLTAGIRLDSSAGVLVIAVVNRGAMIIIR